MWQIWQLQQCLQTLMLDRIHLHLQLLDLLIAQPPRFLNRRGVEPLTFGAGNFVA